MEAKKVSQKYVGVFFRRGQVVLEYAILVAVVAAAFMAMGFYVRRAVQGSINTIERRGVLAKAEGIPVYKSPFTTNW